MSETDKTAGPTGVVKPLKNNRVGKIKPEKETNESCAVNSDKQGDEHTEPHHATAKHRRKIRQPKQYKPRFKDDRGQDGNNENDTVSPVIDEETKETHESQAKPNGTQVSPSLSPSSPVDTFESREEITSQDSPVDVVSTFTKPVGGSGSSKRPGPKSPKRSGGRGTTKRLRHQHPVVPMKPEDLIRDSLAGGDSSILVTKRDAQYRKSYAYKIWKEKGGCKVQGESDEPNSYGSRGEGTVGNPLPPIQRQTPMYWPPNQYNGTNNATGFFANGEYYGVNPPQIIHGVNSGPQISRSIPVPPVVHKPQQPASQPFIPNQATVKDGLQAPLNVPREIPATPLNAAVPECPPVPKTPPQVIPTYPSSSPENNQSPSSTQDDIVHNAKMAKSKENGKISKKNVKKCNLPSKDKAQEQDNNVSSSPTSLMSVMKSTLRKKHCKENVQPLTATLKSKLKRKADTGNNDESPVKKNAKPTIFTPLDEQQAEKLANDIYDVNLEYFPFQTLAEKASQGGDDKKAKAEDNQTNKADDIDNVRCLLKDFYDVTRSCAEDPDMQKFDSASRKFGRKNILNHLSLLDRYLAELQKRVDSIG